MKRLQQTLACALLASLIVLVVFCILEVRTTTATVAAIPGEIQATRTALVAEVDKQASGIRRDASGQVAALRTETLARMDTLSAMLDKRTGEALQIADVRLRGVQGTLDGMRGDLSPVLLNAATLEANYAALGKDARDSLDDLYPDIKASTESATVAITSAAHASEAVRDAAPKVAASVVAVGKSSVGIAADVKREADDITRPKRWYEKLIGPAYTIGRLVAAFL